MRTQLFRTQPVLINGAGVVAALKDVDGVAPLTVFVENMDQAASLRTKFGSKNANIRFAAVAAGTAGNLLSVEFTVAPDQAFSVDVAAYVITVNLRCDSDGIPLQTANEVIDLVNADTDANVLVRASLAMGSDGSGSPGEMDESDLTGGAAASATGAVTVEVAPTATGPWVADSAAGTALSTVAANTVKSYAFTYPVRGLRVKVSTGGGDTRVVVTGQGTKKGL